MTDRREEPSFVDTNVLVYALAGDDPVRSPRAQELLKGLMRTNLLRCSTQVLQECYVALTRKVKSRLDPEQALRYLDQIATWPVTTIDYPMIRDAAHVQARDRVSFWDALIVVAASRSGAVRLYSEDLNAGQRIFGVEVVNPFRDPAARPSP
jgi:predicted nucleic acid-binding protein